MFSFIYSIPYFVFVAILIILIIIEHYRCISPKEKTDIRYLASSIFILFLGFRGYIGWDWASYTEYYDIITWNSVLNLTTEPGFSIFTLLSKMIYNNYHFYVLLNVLIDISLLNIFIKRYLNNYSLGLLLYFIFCFSIEVDNLRNVKSILLFMISIKYIMERNPKQYFFLNIIGVFFHYSALLYLPLYFILNKPISRNRIITIFVIGNVIFLLQIHYLIPIILKVADLFGGGKIAVAIIAYSTHSFNYGLSVGYLERIITMFMIICYYNKLIYLKPYNYLFINLYILYFFFFFYFTEVYVLSVRFAGLFIFSYIVIWQNLFQSIFYKNNKMIFVIFMVVYFFAKTYGLTNTIFYQYDNILFNSKSYEERISIFYTYSESLKRHE